MIKKAQKNKGFTLIEVLLVMAIIVILAGGSYVGFVKFGRQQSLNIARDNLLNTLNEARSSAMSQVITRCTNSQTLVGHQVRFDTSGDPQYYATQEVCRNNSDGTIANSVDEKKVNLSKDVTFTTTPGSPVLFLVLTGGVNSSANIIIQSGGLGGAARNVTVNVDGVISSN